LAGQQGPQGSQGPAGPAGPPGPVGSGGINYLGEWSPASSYAANSLVVYNGNPFFCIAPTSPPVNSATLPPAMPLPTSSGNTLFVGAGQAYSNLAAAVAAASPGDTIDVLAGSYSGEFIAINKNLTITGVGNPTVTYNGGTGPYNAGPYIELTGDNVNVSIANINFVGLGVNTAIFGDTNVAYGPALPGTNDLLHLINVTVSNTAGTSIYAVKPSASYDIQGGVFSSTIMMVSGVQLSVTPSGSTGTTLSNSASGGPGIQLLNGFSNGWVTVRGASFSVGGQQAVTMSNASTGIVQNQKYVALSGNTFNSTTNHFDFNAIDLTSSLPPDPSYFSIINGSVNPFAPPTSTPDVDAAHWLKL
jgi:hypothetical protein